MWADPPSRPSILKWHQKSVETGSVLYTKSAGRPITSQKRYGPSSIKFPMQSNVIHTYSFQTCWDYYRKRYTVCTIYYFLESQICKVIFETYCTSNYIMDTNLNTVFRHLFYKQVVTHIKLQNNFILFLSPISCI